MPKEMFGSVVDPAVSVGTKKWSTVSLSILVHGVGLAALTVVPLMAGMLPTPDSVLVFAATPTAPPPPSVPTHAPTAVTPVMPLNPEAPPIDAPSQITAEPPPSVIPIHGVGGGIAGSLPTAGVLLSPPPDTPPPPTIVRPGGDIKDPRKVYDVRPIYPAMALAARTEGTVILEATISKEGNVLDAKVLRSQPLLDRAALDAVRQWKFTPTLLNGVPVEVLMTVTVNFTLH